MEKVKYVQRVRKGERVHLYFRKDGFRQALEAHDGDTAAIRAEVDAILQAIEEVAQAQRPKPGTVAGMLDAYRRSAEFAGLAGSTQAEYGRLIDELKADCGADLLESVTAAWLNDLRDAWASRGYKAANDRRQVLKNALAPALADERIATDPFAKVGKLKRPHDMGESHPYWEDAEVDAFLALALARKMPGLARAVGLGRWGGFRRGTICAIPLNARLEATDDDGAPVRRLFWMTEKRRVLCDKREDPRLTALLADTPNKALTVAYNDRGLPWKERALNQAIERLVAVLAAEGKARAGLTPHGLRHARGVELALAGASDAEIMAQLEHTTPHQAQVYRRQAERRRLADSGQDRVDSVVELKAARKAKAERV
jgi:integrase